MTFFVCAMGLVHYWLEYYFHCYWANVQFCWLNIKSNWCHVNYIACVCGYSVSVLLLNVGICSTYCGYRHLIWRIMRVDTFECCNFWQYYFQWWILYLFYTWGCFIIIFQTTSRSQEALPYLGLRRGYIKNLEQITCCKQRWDMFWKWYFSVNLFNLRIWL